MITVQKIITITCISTLVKLFQVTLLELARHPKGDYMIDSERHISCQFFDQIDASHSEKMPARDQKMLHMLDIMIKSGYSFTQFEFNLAMIFLTRPYVMILSS
jgi:hypothetical protein